MRGFYLFLISILASYQCLCQEESDRMSEFNIICYNKLVDKSIASKFILKLINNSDSTLKLPHLFLSGPYMLPGIELGFEIFYCSTDTLNITDSITIHFSIQPWERLKYNYLQSHEKQLIEYEIPPLFFKRKGLYKIRFIFHAEKFIRNLYPIKTEWVFVECRDDL